MTANKKVDRIGISTNGSQSLSVQFVDRSGKGKSVWWDIDPEKAELLRAALNVFLNAPSLDFPEDIAP